MITKGENLISVGAKGEWMFSIPVVEAGGIAKVNRTTLYLFRTDI